MPDQVGHDDDGNDEEMPDQVSSYVCKAFEVIKSRAGDKPDKISDVLYRKKLQYFGYF
jgi:hypothetical protein